MWHVAEIVGVLVLLICFGVRAASQHASSPAERSTEMQRIFSEDQADRQMNMAAMTPEQRLDWLNKFGPRGAQRRKQVMDLHLARHSVPFNLRPPCIPSRACGILAESEREYLTSPLFPNFQPIFP